MHCTFKPHAIGEVAVVRVADAVVTPTDPSVLWTSHEMLSAQTLGGGLQQADAIAVDPP
jgi:hypothetical protein